MPINVKNIDGTRIELDNIEFVKDINQNYFTLYDNSHIIEMRFNYAPVLEEWDSSKYIIYSFENPYLTAENDIFEIYFTDNKSNRIGYVFPISALESADNSYKSGERAMKILNGYRFVAYKKILDSNITIDSSLKSEYTLSDLFSSKTHILVLAKSDLPLDFNINDYLLSLFSFGFTPLNSIPKAIRYKANTIQHDQRGKSNIYITKSLFSVEKNDFCQKLFFDYLISFDNGLLRFILIYQIIELLIKEEYDKQFKIHLDEYNTSKISVNDFRERINDLMSEKYRIDILFKNTRIDNDIINTFRNECVSLFNDISYEYKNDSVSALFYSFRNKIVHEYRALHSKQEEVDYLIYLSEKIVLNLLINYPDLDITTKSELIEATTIISDKVDSSDLYEIEILKINLTVKGKIDLNKVPKR